LSSAKIFDLKNVSNAGFLFAMHMVVAWIDHLSVRQAMHRCVGRDAAAANSYGHKADLISGSQQMLLLHTRCWALWLRADP
jgi:hypothetical protein